MIGFAMGLLTFILINSVAAYLAADCGLVAVFGRDSCADDIVRVGWLLLFYEEGGFDYRRSFDLPALLFNLGIAVTFAFVLGWFSSRGKRTPPG